MGIQVMSVVNYAKGIEHTLLFFFSFFLLFSLFFSSFFFKLKKKEKKKGVLDEQNRGCFLEQTLLSWQRTNGYGTKNKENNEKYFCSRFSFC